MVGYERSGGLVRIPYVSFLERLVIYALLAQVFSRVVLEFGMGMWWFKTVQLKLWLYYGLLLMDHGLWMARGRFQKVPTDWICISLVALFSLITIHGALVGLAWDRSKWSVMEDTAPLVFIVMGILRMQDERAVDYERAFHRLLWLTVGATWISIVFGYAGILRHLPTKVAPQGAVIAIYLALYFTLLARERRGRAVLAHSFLMAGALAFSMDDMNRSTMAFIAVGAVGALVLRMRFDKVGTILAVVAICFMPALAQTVIPVDSKTHSRLVAVFDDEARDQSISIQSRSLEVEEVDAALERSGAFAQAFGLGHGGTYPYRVPGKFEPDHGHAHYAFAFFNLRYGFMGKIYVVCIGGLLLLSILSAARFPSLISFFGAFMSLVCFIYLFTYVNFFNYQSGLPFLCLLAPVRRWIDLRDRVYPTPQRLKFHHATVFQ